MPSKTTSGSGRRTSKVKGGATRKSRGQTARVTPSEEQITRDYNSRLRVSKSLAEEIRFILRDSIERFEIKVHEVDARVKELESAIKKIREKEYENLDRVGDLVGGRVVCLFRSDLTRVRGIIESQFQVDEFDDKHISDPTAFGYMSLHFQCRLRQDYSGPRYDTIKSISFEIQLRTICMHAWSAVQHYLEYKGDWDVPNHLKKDINALSALFYVADSQFEAAYSAKLSASTQATQSIARNEISEEPINLDTLEALISSKFPSRPVGSAGSLSELVHELSGAGYKTLGDVANDIDRAETAFSAYESDRKQGPFLGVGAVRISLGLASEDYRNVMYKNNPSFTKYQKLLHKN
jgi:putative GTP pyrophosphokinase